VTAPRARSPRSTFIDLSRGLAVVCMVEHHTFDAWMPEAFHGSAPDRFFRYLGGVAAPTFLFLAGLSMVLMMEGLLGRGATRREAATAAARRGALILLGAYLFRFQEWAMAFGASPAWTMLRIDVLNCIGLSLALVALLWGLGRSMSGRAALLAGACAAVVLAAPLVLAADLSHWPQVLGDYLNGTSPRALFPLFPWLGFALGGGAVGLWFARARTNPEPGATLTMLSRLSLLCVLVWAVTREVDALPFTLYGNLYPKLDWWRSSPAYFLLRCCTLVWALWFCAVAERLWQPVRARFGWVRPGPLVQMGQHSLVIYWVHIEIVYGRWTWPMRGNLSLAQASAGLALLFAAMIALAYLIDPALEKAAALWRRARAPSTGDGARAT
jgi:uncharacterized membrane protein